MFGMILFRYARNLVDWSQCDRLLDKLATFQSHRYLVESSMFAEA